MNSTNRNTIWQVDAFTQEPFKGNPAGVMIVYHDFSEGKMQQIAAEMNLSETAFLIPEADHFVIRYFTPTNEVDLCGHASLASAHIIFETGLRNQHETVLLKAKGADLEISKNGDFIKMVFPRYNLNPIETPNGFSNLLGFEPVEVYSSNYDWVVAVAANETDILNTSPDFGKLKSTPFANLMITAQSRSYPADFVVRCFAPNDGINEDPVTGSAHCALTPLWANKLGKTELDSMQLSARTGKLKVRLANNKVEIMGKAITVFEAKLKVE
ncbi:MAG: PhzF family phenazine biosynthesis protein [Prolixibacteraceae bacterium]|nr:PhzF family phenazine biosynthesis protein [Prolixibacteraceae bacterium]